MTKQSQDSLGKVLWAIADELRGSMNADDFRDYMLAFLFLRYLSDNYEEAAKKELGQDWPELDPQDRRSPLAVWYEQNPNDIGEFEKYMRRKVHYAIKLQYLWSSIAEMVRTQDEKLLETLQKGSKFIEDEAFSSSFKGLFSEINLNSEKLGKTYKQRNEHLCTIIQKITEELAEDFCFKSYGLAPKSAVDFAFLLHGFHFLHREGTMAIILPHGVLFRGGVEAKIRKMLLLDNNIDTVIGLAPKLFYSTGIPVCTLVLKKCKKYDDVLFINANELFKKRK